tara:strand:+ start:156531 stop:157502 length:972 start_codon:yes stop_codon:yes gene_type:complete
MKNYIDSIFKISHIAIISLLIIFPAKLFSEADSENANIRNDSNFHYIYQKENLKAKFATFLVNVFHLYPEKEFHALIDSTSKQYNKDKDIYINTQENIHTIKPFFSELTYSIPALSKQKKVISKQTAELLPKNKIFNGYLEIGSTGRYYDALKATLALKGDVYFVADHKPNYSFTDMIDRGQLSKAGDFIPLNNYQSKISANIPESSIELVTVYIGFHHCPIDLRDEFIQSIWKVMKPGGFLVVRDHNVNNKDMLKMVSLAHDVFNLGTNETWETNASELRNFYSLDTLNKLMLKNGFTTDGKRLYQSGDPTLNALMLFQKPA